MPVLKIQYGELILFDGEVDGFRWDDLPGHSVTVTGQLTKPKAAGSGLGALAEMITAASRKKTETMIEEKKSADVIEGSND